MEKNGKKWKKMEKKIIFVLDTESYLMEKNDLKISFLSLKLDHI